MGGNGQLDLLKGRDRLAMGWMGLAHEGEMIDPVELSFIEWQ
jgi:hypothetical protein